MCFRLRNGCITLPFQCSIFAIPDYQHTGNSGIHSSDPEKPSKNRHKSTRVKERNKKSLFTASGFLSGPYGSASRYRFPRYCEWLVSLLGNPSLHPLRSVAPSHLAYRHESCREHRHRSSRCSVLPHCLGVAFNF